MLYNARMQSKLPGSPTAQETARQSNAASRREPRSVLGWLLSADGCSIGCSAHHFLHILASLFQVKQASRTEHLSTCCPSISTKFTARLKRLSLAGSENN